MENIKELLPTGSVVRLVDGEKYLMIVGVMQTMAGIRKKECDYLGVLYPEGYLGDEFLYGFNHVDVEEIVFRGYEDQEREEFLTKLSDLYAERDQKKEKEREGFYDRDKYSFIGDIIDAKKRRCLLYRSTDSNWGNKSLMYLYF